MRSAPPRRHMPCYNNITLHNSDKHARKQSRQLKKGTGLGNVDFGREDSEVFDAALHDAYPRAISIRKFSARITEIATSMS